MKKIFFLKFSLFFQNVQLFDNSKKVFIMFDIEYLQKFSYKFSTKYQLFVYLFDKKLNFNIQKFS